MYKAKLWKSPMVQFQLLSHGDNWELVSDLSIFLIKILNDSVRYTTSLVHIGLKSITPFWWYSCFSGLFWWSEPTAIDISARNLWKTLQQIIKHFHTNRSLMKKCYARMYKTCIESFFHLSTARKIYVMSWKCIQIFLATFSTSLLCLS